MMRQSRSQRSREIYSVLPLSFIGGKVRFYQIEKVQNARRERETGNDEASRLKDDCLFVGWLLNVPATCYYISGTHLLRQVYVLPH